MRRLSDASMGRKADNRAVDPPLDAWNANEVADMNSADVPRNPVAWAFCGDLKDVRDRVPEIVSARHISAGNVAARF